MDTTRTCPTPNPLTTLKLEDEPSFRARFELLEEVGRGGMGIVYRARHKSLDRPVAIKVTLPEAATERFLREARLLAKIKSPFVVSVHDFDILPNGCPMLVMEWVEGTNLKQLMKARAEPLPEVEALPLMRHTCEGMSMAADQGITHRDLKPSNLLIDAQGCAKVADFGLARGPTLDSELSRSGIIMGTPLYMAPEQAEDPHGVDTRADIYGFGATFYHALTGRPPFNGATVFSVLYKHKTEPLISPQALRPGLSDRLRDVLERCLAKAPTDRFPSFAEVMKHLGPSPVGLSPWITSDDRELAPYLAQYQARKVDYLTEYQDQERELDVYHFPRGQVLRIVQGNIVSQRADAIVSSDTWELGMDYGVSFAILRAGGQTIADQARFLAPVRPGRVVVTAAGNLPARFVFHGVTVGYVGRRLVSPSRDLIAEIMASCFYHADSHEVTSIAFPLLATGGQGFPRDVCLDTMFQFLARMFLRGLTSVRDARIVLYCPPSDR